MSELLFEYKVRARHRLGWKEFSFYATTDIEEFLNRNSINYVRNMTDTVEHRQLKEIERLNNKEEQLIRRLEDLIIVGEQVENEWAVDTFKMLINELKGSDKE